MDLRLSWAQPVEAHQQVGSPAFLYRGRIFLFGQKFVLVQRFEPALQSLLNKYSK